MSYLAQRDSAEKTSKDRPNVLMAKNEDRDAVILYLSYQVQIAIGVGMLVNIAMLTKVFTTIAIYDQSDKYKMTASRSSFFVINTLGLVF